MSKRWKKLSEETISQNPFWKYKHGQFERPKTGIKDCYYGETDGSVLLVPVLADGRLVLVSRYRCLEEKMSVEFFCGRVEDGQTVLDAAKDELREKIGYTADELVSVGEFQPANGLLKDKTKVFLAEVENEIAPQLISADESEILYRRPDEVDEMVRKNEIWDGKTLAAWALAHFEFLHKSQLC